MARNTKRFRPRGILFFLLIGMFCAMIALSVVAIVLFSIENDVEQIKRIVVLVEAPIIFVGFTAYLIFFLLRTRIDLVDDGVFIPKDEKFFDSSTVQFEVNILYRKIGGFELNYRSTNSRRSSVYNGKGGAFLYLEFLLKERGRRSVLVSYYSKKQIAEIIDAVKERCAAVGNVLSVLSGEEIVRAFYHDIEERRKRKKK